ncbi:MAG TPA: hypothetical protein VFE47_27580 [Tepidisphaeraceae bacterium]|jgi:hypothetical protein|nr:hypothetical protein [Tepidisphaeraceae bacterium]
MANPSDFRWNEFNLDKVAKHGVKPREAERVVRFATRPYPRPHKKGTYYVLGRGDSNRRLQVIYLLDEDGTAYIIHAMPVRR